MFLLVFGIILMGVRLYNTTTGRFLQVDPVYGGSCNAYDYTCADPINQEDLDGKWIALIARGVVAGCKLWKSWCARAGKYVGKHAWRWGKTAWRHSWKFAKSTWNSSWRYTKRNWNYLFGKSGYVTGSAKAGRKGWINRGPARIGWTWKASEGRYRFGLHTGWPKYKQKNWFHRKFPRIHWDWF